METDRKIYTKAFAFYGPEGSGDSLRVEEEVDGDGFILSTVSGGKTATITLSREQWDLLTRELRYKL